MDEKIEAMLGSIDSAVLENTTIIFMADNGTPRFRSEQFPDNRLKDSMFEGGINVPLIITDGYTYLHPTKESPDHTYPGWVASPNRIATALVQEVDLFATIADIAGADKSTAIDAATLIPLLESTGDSPVRAFVFEQAADTVWTVRGPEFKLIRSNILFTASPHSEAYDLANDRWEESAAAESVFGFSMLTVYKMVARAISASLEL
jgi:arylsulfatase A-like enzyme